METKKLFGQIYSPDHPDNIIQGVWLTISNTGIYLETQLNTLRDENWTVLHGVFNGMDRVTLVHCHAGAGSSGSGGTWRKIWVSYLLKGCHINNFSDLKFKRIVLANPALNKWIISRNFLDTVEDTKIIIPPKEIITSFNLSNFSITVYLFYAREGGFRSLNIERSCFVEVSFNESTHLDEFSEITTSLKKLILFLTNSNPEYKRHYIFDENGDEYELINVKNDLLEERFTQNLKFNYLHLKESIDTIFETWLKTEKLETIVDLIQEKEFNPDMSFQNYFLNMCVAIESYHYIFGDESKNDKIQVRLSDRDEILALIDNAELRKRFENVSQRWNESTYRERLKSFKATFDSIMGDTFPFKSGKLINYIVNTRNSLAHSGTYKHILKHIELLLIGKVIEFTLKLEVLKILNYQPEKENEVLESAKSHIQILARINEYGKYNKSSVKKNSKV